MAHLYCKNTTFTSYDKIEKILSKTEKQIKKYITSDPDEIEKLWYGQFTINLIRYFEQIRIKFITNPSTKLDLDSLIEDINNLTRSLPLDIENKEEVFEFRNSLKTRSIVALGRLGNNREYFKLSTNEQIFNYILENTIDVILDEEEYRGHLPEEDCDEILYNYNYLWTILGEHGFFVLGKLHSVYIDFFFNEDYKLIKQYIVCSSTEGLVTENFKSQHRLFAELTKFIEPKGLNQTPKCSNLMLSIKLLFNGFTCEFEPTFAINSEIPKDQFKILYNSSIVQQIEEFFKLNILAGYHLDNDINYAWILAITPKKINNRQIKF